MLRWSGPGVKSSTFGCASQLCMYSTVALAVSGDCSMRAFLAIRRKPNSAGRGQPDPMRAVDALLPPCVRAGMLRKTGDDRVEQQIDVRNDHEDRRALPMIDSSSSSPTSLLKPPMSNPGRTADS